MRLSERIYIQSQLELGFKVAAIAAALKREPSIIGRELRRNGWKRSARSHAKAECRPLPPVIDQTLEAEPPGCCPHCGGELEETRIEKQYQTEIPQPQVERIEFGAVLDNYFR